MGAHGPIDLLTHVIDPNRAVEPNDLVEHVVIELLAQRKEGVVDDSEVDDPASRVVIRTRHGDDNAVTMTVETSTGMALGNFGQSMSRLEPVLLEHVHDESVADWRVDAIRRGRNPAAGKTTLPKGLPQSRFRRSPTKLRLAAALLVDAVEWRTGIQPDRDAAHGFLRELHAVVALLEEGVQLGCPRPELTREQLRRRSPPSHRSPTGDHGVL